MDRGPAHAFKRSNPRRSVHACCHVSVVSSAGSCRLRWRRGRDGEPSCTHVRRSAHHRWPHPSHSSAAHTRTSHLASSWRLARGRQAPKHWAKHIPGAWPSTGANECWDPRRGPLRQARARGSALSQQHQEGQTESSAHAICLPDMRYTKREGPRRRTQAPYAAALRVVRCATHAGWHDVRHTPNTRTPAATHVLRKHRTTRRRLSACACPPKGHAMTKQGAAPGTLSSTRPAQTRNPCCCVPFCAPQRLTRSAPAQRPWRAHTPCCTLPSAP